MRLLPAILVMLMVAAVGGAPQALVNPYEKERRPATQVHPIDEAVFSQLKKLEIEPAPLCSDAVFLRRVYLDLIGTLPTAAEAREFLADTRLDRRAILVDRLLERSEFNDYWAMKWADLLRVKAEFPINLWPNAVQGYHRWIYCAIRDRMPLDRFAREMLTATGSNFRVPQANFYRAVQNRRAEGLAEAVALTFMGCRADRWPADRLQAMGLFFSQVAYKSTGEWKEEIVLCNRDKGTTRPTVFPDGSPASIAPGDDYRVAFADWLLKPGNPFFARAIANRAWYWMMGRGVVHEPDDIRPDNPPVNAKLLDTIERQVVACRYDLRQLLRWIANSQTYQLSSIPPAAGSEAGANFACYSLRRLDAEVLIDAIDLITGTTEKYSSAIPEPFTFIPPSQRSIELADGSISSSFLEMFGRPNRDTGMEAERNNRTTPDQRLHMLNSSHIQRKIEQSQKLRANLPARNTLKQNATELYLSILSRPPTSEELATIDTYARASTLRNRDVLTDVAWALVNSAEFLHRH
jgi:hypothetical protein